MEEVEKMIDTTKKTKRLIFLMIFALVLEIGLSYVCVTQKEVLAENGLLTPAIIFLGCFALYTLLTVVALMEARDFYESMTIHVDSDLTELANFLNGDKKTNLPDGIHLLPMDAETEKEVEELLRQLFGYEFEDEDNEEDDNEEQ